MQVRTYMYVPQNSTVVGKKNFTLRMSIEQIVCISSDEKPGPPKFLKDTMTPDDEGTSRRRRDQRGTSAQAETLGNFDNFRLVPAGPAK